jgi:hypothetical protein
VDPRALVAGGHVRQPVRAFERERLEDLHGQRFFSILRRQSWMNARLESPLRPFSPALR